MSEKKRGSLLRLLPLLILCILMLSFFIFADVITSTNRLMTNNVSNSTVSSFDFETNLSVSSSNTTGDILYSNQTGATIYARSGKIAPLGPNVNISEIWSVKNVSDTGGYGPSYMPSIFLYQSNDGFVVYTTANRYAVFVVTAFNETSMAFDVRYQNNGSNIFGAQPVNPCSIYLNDTSCMQAASQGKQCFWDFGQQSCRESNYFGGQQSNFFDEKVQCYQFDGMQDACLNITRCVWTSADNLCDNNESSIATSPAFGFNMSAGLVCADINATASLGTLSSAQKICNNMPKTKPLCTWNTATRVCENNITKTQADLPQSPYAFCEGASNKTDCDTLRTTFFKSCSWDNKSNTNSVDDECKFVIDDIFGVGATDHSFMAINSQANCEAIGGTWKTETYLSTVNGVSQLSTSSWCEPSFGSVTQTSCSNSCWGCEYQSNGSKWADVASASKECFNSTLGYCQWINATYAPNQQGFCEPAQQAMSGFGNCNQECYACFTNQSCANSATSCLWTPDPFNPSSGFGFCEPAAVAQKKQCSNGTASGCLGCFGQNECAAKGGLCAWNATYFACTMTNGSFAELCFLPGDENGNGKADCADPACSQDPFCGFGLGSGGGGFNENQTKCSTFDGTSRGQCENTTEFGGNVCYWHNITVGGTQKGLCDPKSFQSLAGSMDFKTPPVKIGTEASGDAAGGQLYVDIVGVGLKENPGSKEKFSVGIEVSNISTFAGCNAVFRPSQNLTGKYYRYFDVDENTTNGCNAMQGNGQNSSGYEYRFTLIENSSILGRQQILSERCTSNVWAPYAAQVGVLDEGCFFSFSGVDGSAVGGVQIMILKKSDLGSPTVPLRILVATANDSTGANNPVDSAGPFYYTPGTVDVAFEDCASTGVDEDHDGLTSENDPDCQKFLKLGYVPHEQGPQCKDGKDNDADGNTDCDDESCKYDPVGICNSGGLTCLSGDYKSPSLSWKSVDTTSNSAVVEFDTTEAANGTIIFYKNDSGCTSENKTLLDVGLLDTFAANDFRLSHDVHLSQAKLGYALSNATTYYYKLKSCDLCNNCLVSACINFTTASVLANYVVKMPVSSGFTFDIPKWGLSNDSFQYGTLVNDSVGTDVDITITDKSNGYSITLYNVSLLEASSLNLTGDFVFNTSGDTHVGMDSDEAEELMQELDPQYVQIKIPDNGSSLLHCEEDNLTNCYNVTSLVNCTFASTYTNCTIPISSGLGFSVYKVTGGATTSSPTPSPSSSSGSGGGAGGAGGNASTGKVSHTFTEVKPSEASVLQIKDGTLALTEISIEVNNPALNVKVIVQREDQKPASVTQEIDGVVYKYLTITKENLADDNLKSAKIKFVVPKSWLSDNNVDINSVSLMRFTDKWDELSTTTLNADTEFVTYESTTPGFSVFAIAGKEAAPAEAAPESSQQAQEEAAPVSEQASVAAEEKAEGRGGMVLWVVLFSLVMVGIIVMAVLIRKRLREKK